MDMRQTRRGFLATALLISGNRWDLAAHPGSAQTATPVSDAPALSTLDLLWQSTGDDRGLLLPTDLALAPDGTIWVIDAANERVVILSPDGAFVDAWGSVGSDEGQFHFTAEGKGQEGGIAIAADGTVSIADTFNTRVQVFDANQQFVTSWGTRGAGDGQFLRPGGVAVGADGTVFVSDVDRDDVQAFDAQGQYLGTIGAPGQHSDPSYPAVDAAGNLYVVEFEQARVSVFSPDGALLRSWGSRGREAGQFDGPYAVALDPQGNAYVTDPSTARIERFAPDGQFLNAWTILKAGAPDTPFVSNLRVDEGGHLYAVDNQNGRVLKFQLPAAGDVATPVTPQQIHVPQRSPWPRTRTKEASCI